MKELLLEFLKNILNEARPPKMAAKKTPGVNEPPPGLFHKSYGNYYKDQNFTQYAGKMSKGKWIPAEKDVHTPSVKKKSAAKKVAKKAPAKTTVAKEPKVRKRTGGAKGMPDIDMPKTPKKDKSLKDVDTLKSKEFNRKEEPSDAEFNKRNKDFQIGPPPPAFKMPKELLNNPRIPQRHLKSLERLINTRSTQKTSKWSHFSGIPGGAGKISAQAGELMTLIGTTLNDDEAEQLYSALMDHEAKQIKANPSLKGEGTRIVTKSWIQAAKNNRKAIRQRLQKEYPGATIEAGAWDTESEVSALGLSDYKKNKGFSTDVYFKIKTADGNYVLDEVSLKKSTKVNFLNSGTGQLLEWDPDIPDEINPNVYSKNQRASLLKFGSSNLKDLQKAVKGNAEFAETVASKGITLEEALDKLEKGKGSRAINKVVLTAIKVAAQSGNKDALNYIKDVDSIHKKHQTDVIQALGSNSKLKQGMLSSIREEFPLKAVGEGEESMAIGPYSLDRSVLTAIFNTSDFEQIKEGLFAVTDEEPPYLAYKAGKKGRVVPIATIVAREDGVGYGGQIKFEMQLDPRFATIIEEANKYVYGR
jgi:hypothetical protein